MKFLKRPGRSLCDEGEAFEMDRPAVIACGKAPKMLESVKAAFDAVAMPVGFDIMRDDEFAGAVVRMLASVERTASGAELASGEAGGLSFPQRSGVDDPLAGDAISI